MAILCDASSLVHPKKTGVELYLLEVLRAAARLQLFEQNDRFCVPTSLLELHLELPQLTPLASPLKRGWLQTRFVLETWCAKETVWMPTHAIPAGIRGEVVATVHDVAFLKHPELYHPSERDRQARALESVRTRADRVICVSEATQAAFLEAAPEFVGCTTVTPLGVDRTRFLRCAPEQIMGVHAAYDLPARYHLFVGRREKKKGLPFLIDLIETHGRELQDPVVLCGFDGYGAEEWRRRQQALEASGRLVVREYVHENDLPAVISGATSLVFPTLAEGFGLPILEAMSCGIPVVATDLPVLREVSGGHVTLLPHDTELWMKVISAYESGYDDQKRLVAQQWAQSFSWEACARATFAFLRLRF